MVFFVFIPYSKESCDFGFPIRKKTASLANLNISFFSGGFTSYYKHCELINWKEEKLKWKENREGEEEFAIEERGEGTPVVWSHSKAESKD